MGCSESVCDESQSPILVTGATGFVGSHIVKLLLQHGLKVRATCTNLNDTSKYKFLFKQAPERNHLLEIVKGNILDKQDWPELVDGIDYVIHCAGPNPLTMMTEEELINNCVEGTKNVLEACLKEGVKRVVITSSALTMAFGSPWNERNWAKPKLMGGYGKAKLLQEKYVFDFYEKHKDEIEICVINGVTAHGPILSKNHKRCTASLLVDILTQKIAGCPEPDIEFTVVDVRDFAAAHIKALFHTQVQGQRYLLGSSVVKMSNVLKVLGDKFESYGYKISNEKKSLDQMEKEIKDNKVTSGRLLMEQARMKVQFENQKSIRELTVKYIKPEETFIDTIGSWLQLRLIERKD